MESLSVNMNFSFSSLAINTKDGLKKMVHQPLKAEDSEIVRVTDHCDVNILRLMQLLTV